MTPTQARKVLPIYRRQLAQYEAEGDQERADIQRRLIAWLEKDAKDK